MVMVVWRGISSIRTQKIQKHANIYNIPRKGAHHDQSSTLLYTLAKKKKKKKRSFTCEIFLSLLNFILFVLGHVINNDERMFVNLI